MNVSGKLKRASGALEAAFLANFGFRPSETSWRRAAEYLHRPRDPASLAVTRMLFGLAMLLDIPDERGGATMEKRWGDPRDCRFPLFPFLQPAPLPYMALLYAVMWIGALGVALGYKFRASAFMFAAPYWYILLVEKSFWNNHSYLFGLVGVLLLTTQANRYMSVDAYLNPSLYDQPVPQWNYSLLKYQFFILYFLAGVKKGSSEWLTGYAMTSLSDHWVFSPFKIFLSTEQTDYLVVHWFAFLFDLTVAFWMCWRRTREPAMVLCAAFHLMNSRLFRIGMFPWVCLATMPLFYPEDWPKIILVKLKQIPDIVNNYLFKPKQENNQINDRVEDDDFNDAKDEGENYSKVENIASLETNSECKNDVVEHVPQTTKESRKRQLVTCLVVIYMILQAFLPFSHFLTKGYNNWTNGLYGYSWDMMVHSWDNIALVVKVVDNENNMEYNLKPGIWTPNDRWSRHGDMVYQYAHCIKRNILADIDGILTCSSHTCHDKAVSEWRGALGAKRMSRNISVYVDIWYSMNGRFQQRMFDPSVDLLRAEWSPFRPVAWLMPLLQGHSRMRGLLDDIRERVYAQGNRTGVTFVADFPGRHLENFIAPELSNVSLTVLDGQLVYEPPVLTSKYRRLYEGQSVRLARGDSVAVPPGHYHKVRVVGDVPSCYMYTFANESRGDGTREVRMEEKLPIWKEIVERGSQMVKFFKLLGRNLKSFIIV